MISVLLIEDHEDTRDLLTLLLSSQGFRVASSTTFTKALAILEVDAFDLVLSDFLVQSTDADECWAQLAKIHALAKSRVGLLTAFKLDPAEVGRRGLDFLLRKPCSSDDLLGQLSLSIGLPDVSSDQEALVRGYFGALGRGDYPGVAELCTRDVIYYLPRAPVPMPERVVGRADFTAFARTTFQQFRDPRFTVSAISALPSGALVRYTGSWVDDTGVRQVLPGAVLFSFAAGAIAEIGVRCDLSVIS